MADGAGPLPHQGAWFWAGGSLIAIAIAIGTVYGDRASHLSGFAPAMLLAYFLAVIALMCLFGGIRGWRFPFSEPKAPRPKSSAAEVAPPKPTAGGKYAVSDEFGTHTLSPSGTDVTSASVFAPSGELQRVYRAENIPQGDLKGQLMQALQKGMDLMGNLPGIGRINVAVFAGIETTEADVIEWEDGIEAILRNEPRKLIRFKADEKPNPMLAAIPLLATFTTPLQRRMTHRLNSLERIIKDMA